MPEAANSLRESSAAVRVHFAPWWSPNQSMESHHRAEIADRFSADNKFVGGSKKLFSSKNPAIRKINAFRGAITELWKEGTLPYVEPGVRLIRRNSIPDFNATLEGRRGEFNQLVQEVAGAFPNIKEEAREKLGRLYNEADYPADVRGKFNFSWDFPSVEPPEYLLRLNPRLYEQEQQRVRGQFEQAIRMAEEGFAAQMADLVEHLHERLAPAPNGQAKVFRSTAVTGFQEFFRRFRSLTDGLPGNEQLTELVSQAEGLVGGLDPNDLRRSAETRQRIEAGLNQIKERLEPLVTTERRRAWRPSKPVEAATPSQTANEPTADSEVLNGSKL